MGWRGQWVQDLLNRQKQRQPLGVRHMDLRWTRDRSWGIEVKLEVSVHCSISLYITEDAWNILQANKVYEYEDEDAESESDSDGREENESQFKTSISGYSVKGTVHRVLLKPE